MPTATKPKRRSIYAPDPMAKLRPILEERSEAVRRGRYRILGTIQSIRTPEGVLRFPHLSGPAVAFMADGETQLVVVTPWNGLPALRELTTKFCPDCLRDCDVCKGGMKICEGYQCGGRGTVDNGDTCKMCNRTGEMPCPVCRGELKASTGLKDGSTDYSQPRCETCSGLKYQGEDIPQSLEPYIQRDAQLDPITVVGPIIRLVVAGVPGEPKTQIVFDVEPDQDGDLLVLLLEPTPSVTRAYLVGGILKERGGR